MEPDNDHKEKLEHRLALILLELIDKPIDLELHQPTKPHGLIATGTLLRAFDVPGQPSLTLVVGSQTTTLRPLDLINISLTRNPQRPHTIQNVHLLLSDHTAIHIKPQH